MEFEHPFGAAMTASGTVTVLDPAAGAFPPTTIIQRDHAWKVQVEWEINGPAAPAVGGEWVVRCYLESIGPGFEGQIGVPETVPLADAPPLPLPREYEREIDIDAAEILGISDGAYRLVTLINYENGGIPGEIAGHQEGPIVQFYTAT